MFEKIANWFSEEEKPNLGEKDPKNKNYKETEEVESDDLTPDEVLMQKEEQVSDPEDDTFETKENPEPYTNEDIDEDYAKEIADLDEEEKIRGDLNLKQSPEDFEETLPKMEPKPKDFFGDRDERDQTHIDKRKRPKGGETIRKGDIEEAA